MNRCSFWCVTAVLVAAIILSVASGCANLQFSPGFSMNDPAYFAEAPHIVRRPDGYSLRWRYGTMGFFFQPSVKAVRGELLFGLHATSSSGSRSGRYGELPITKAEHIRALEYGGALWVEPSGRTVRLEQIEIDDE